MQKKQLKDLNPQGRLILVRVDFNVPIDPKSGKILSHERIDAAIPTLKWLLERGGRVIVISHMGRPNGKYDRKLSLEQCIPRLKEKLSTDVQFCSECIGPLAQYMASQLKPGEILLLENLRFHEEEETPSLEFCEKLADLADDYVNDAFAVSHRRNASVWNLPKVFFPLHSYAGFQLEKEMRNLSKLLHQPSSPFSAVVGGSKISSKMGLLSRLLQIIDHLFIGGSMCLPFIKAQGKLPHFTVDEEQTRMAKEILTLAADQKKSIHLPVDFHCSDALTNPKFATLNPEQIKTGNIPFDLGEKTIETWCKELNSSQTIFWNGPLGAYEWPPYDLSSKLLAKYLSESKARAIIVGGGDTVACFSSLPQQPNLFLSTGGGATLELIEQGSLPGYLALSDKNS